MNDGTAPLTQRSDRTGRREQNKAENITALLKAARGVFAEMGYGAASVRDIVQAAGVLGMIDGLFVPIHHHRETYALRPVAMDHASGLALTGSF